MKTITRLEAMDIFSENLPEIKVALEQNMESELSQVPTPKDSNARKFQLKAWLYILERELIEEKFKPTIRSITAFLSPYTKDKITQVDIDRAKEHPIENIFPNPIRRKMAICPFHAEKTPSCEIRKNNTFICYGCGEHGDTIDLYQKLNNVSFLEAVTKLK